ncbi:type II toxin-antitoxin system HicA family toxin [Halomonas salifodinae]|uniref:type II toxin-antitoxin system HicA family toxin n=1 Tax=Halomonas salifodinae TaxID=438745 RepID=UPI0033AEC7F8
MFYHRNQPEGPAVKSRDLIKELEADGWYLDRVRGSHHVFKHPNKPGAVPVPHPKKDLPPGTIHSIRKQAGLK